MERRDALDEPEEKERERERREKYSSSNDDDDSGKCIAPEARWPWRRPTGEGKDDRLRDILSFYPFYLNRATTAVASTTTIPLLLGPQPRPSITTLWREGRQRRRLSAMFAGRFSKSLDSASAANIAKLCSCPAAKNCVTYWTVKKKVHRYEYERCSELSYRCFNVIQIFKTKAKTKTNFLYVKIDFYPCASFANSVSIIIVTWNWTDFLSLFQSLSRLKKLISLIWKFQSISI